MSNQVVFVLEDISSEGEGLSGVYSSFELAKQAAYMVIDKNEEVDDTHINIYAIAIDSFESIRSGEECIRVAGFSGEDGWWEDLQDAEILSDS